MREGAAGGQEKNAEKGNQREEMKTEKRKKEDAII